MSKERKPRLAQRLQTDRGLYRALQRWGYYLLALMAWVTVVLAVSALGVLVCSRLTWYETDPLYHLLLWVRDYYFFFCIAVVLLGWVVISWHFISRPVRQLDALIGASAQLTRPTEEPIHLPASMKSVEDQLNLAREEALRAQRAAREAEQRKNDLVVYLAHDLKTPLTSISGYAELIETGIAKPEDVPGFAQKIHVEASRMIQLVNDILQLSHLDSVSETHAQPDMETVDLLDVAKDCVERQKLNAQRSFISLTYLGESARVLGNRDQLDELCQNLCDNAIRYNRPGGKVQLITSCTRDGHCTLTVKDNGIGIPKDAQSSVFERFYRVDKSRSKATGGTGLGLAIVKHIARIHNARIKLESEVNVGTSITVVFETAH